ncbi:hypothetical protein FCL40_05675 [Ferrimonas sediminicola]|uniref:Alginate export domain-containing protein n=1 Tax=Ferrimonas sediminicola TaxID=2569538 RepID=A0A4U1BHU3_9GAMM|nr:hypothetical protein [Ferrimonas sediminicola]TKB50637.1 hypothetical protein FCL40_05675 [Ferrimonas sediminicola]
MRLALLLPFSAQALAQIPGLAPQSPWELSGYLKGMTSLSQPDGAASRSEQLLHQRIDLEYRGRQGWRFNLGMRNRLLYSDALSQPGYDDLIGGDRGYWDLSANWLERDSMLGTSSLDRLYLTWQDSLWQLRGGRFRINWSMTTVWNPNDLFNAYSIYDFDYEERPGSDALMLTRQLGVASELNLVVSPSDDPDRHSYAVRYLFNHLGWDAQLLAGKSDLDRVVGLGLASDLGGAGIRGELSHFDPSDQASQLRQPSWVVSLEGDYSFAGPRNLSVRGALLYISEPLAPPSAADYLRAPLTARTLSFTEFTGYGELGWDLTALTRLTLSASYYDDGSLFTGASFNHSLADDWTLLGVVQRFDGSTASLFGQSPATLWYAQIRWSF